MDIREFMAVLINELNSQKKKKITVNITENNDDKVYIFNNGNETLAAVSINNNSSCLMRCKQWDCKRKIDELYEMCKKQEMIDGHFSDKCAKLFEEYRLCNHNELAYKKKINTIETDVCKIAAKLIDIIHRKMFLPATKTYYYKQFEEYVGLIKDYGRLDTICEQIPAHMPPFPATLGFIRDRAHAIYAIDHHTQKGYITLDEANAINEMSLQGVSYEDAVKALGINVIKTAISCKYTYDRQKYTEAGNSARKPYPFPGNYHIYANGFCDQYSKKASYGVLINNSINRKLYAIGSPVQNINTCIKAKELAINKALKIIKSKIPQGSVCTVYTDHKHIISSLDMIYSQPNSIYNQLKSSMESLNFRYIPSKDNPADKLAKKACKAGKAIQH